MFTNFKAAFKDKPLYETEIPEPILKMINEPLPQGFKYVNVEDGFCRIETDGEFHLAAKNIKLPEKAKLVLPAKFNMDELWSYLYNTQQKAEILPDENGDYLVNGKKIKANELVKAPLKNNIVCESTRFYLVPPEFPKPHEIVIGTQKEKRKIRICRQSHESITEIKFTTVDEGAFELSFIFDSITDKINFSITMTEKHAQNIESIIFANNFFNAILSGEGYIAGIKLPINALYKEKLKSEEEIKFWKTAYKLEEIFNVKFNPNEDITLDLLNSVKLLECCFIDKKPFRKYEKYENVTGSCHTEYSKTENMVGKEMYFEMSAESSIQIFEVKLNIYQVIGIFNAVIKSQQLPEENACGKFVLELEAKEGSPMYSGNMLFLNEEDMSKFRENTEHIEQLKNAQEID
nr:abortive infection system toxin AbiGii family protein [uncultured Lachnoclostridium sp.]